MKRFRLTALLLSTVLFAGTLPPALAAEDTAVSVTVQEEETAEQTTDAQEKAAQAEAAALVQSAITTAANAVQSNPVSGFTRSYPFQHGTYYDDLTTAQKKWYNRMLTAAQSFQPLYCTAEQYGYKALDNILTAQIALWRDYPELEMYFDMTEVLQGNRTVALEAKYFMPGDEEMTALTTASGLAELQYELKVFDAACEMVVEQMPSGLSTYDKYRYLAAFLSAQTHYKFTGRDSSTVYGAVVSGKAVCQGYAIAYRYLCSRANLFCELVTGSSQGESHMWNLVKLSGGTYHVDITWADDGVNQPAEGDWHHYFMMTQDEICEDHEISDDTEATGLRLPKPCKTSDPIADGAVYLIGNLQYEVTRSSRTGKGTVAVCAPRKRAPCTHADIPNTVTINGVSFSVTVIDDEAFRGCPNLTRVTIGTNVTEIGTRAFSRDSKLSSIRIRSRKLTAVGSKAISGIYKKAVIEVPTSRKKKYSALFREKTGFRSTMKLTVLS